MSRNHVRPTALALVVALAAVILASPVASGAGSPGPQLSIAIDDGEASADAGDALTYVITIDNQGSSPVRNLRVSQTLPDGLAFVSANHHGVEKAAEVTWSVDLRPGGRATLRTTSELGQTPDDLLRLATVACAAETPTAAPVVCASDSDQLPAGAAAGVSVSPDDGALTNHSWTSPSTPQVVGLAALLLVLLAGLGGFTHRARGAHAAPR